MALVVFSPDWRPCTFAEIVSSLEELFHKMCLKVGCQQPSSLPLKGVNILVTNSQMYFQLDFCHSREYPLILITSTLSAVRPSTSTLSRHLFWPLWKKWLHDPRSLSLFCLFKSSLQAVFKVSYSCLLSLSDAVNELSPLGFLVPYQPARVRSSTAERLRYLNGLFGKMFQIFKDYLGILHSNFQKRSVHFLIWKHGKDCLNR